MCLVREEFIWVHPTRKLFGCKGYGGYVPSKLPTIITKETMKSAFNDYFARFVNGESNANVLAIEIVKIIKEEVNSGRWKKFEYTTDENARRGVGYRAEIRICGTEINLTIKIRKQMRMLISDASFDPGESQELQRYKNFWNDIVNA